jgi:Activator of Hsp90 ATPase homolog 1-like protein
MRKVEATIQIDHPAAAVFNAFVEPSQLKKWWGVERCLIEKKQGGIYSLAWNISDQGFQYISTGVITVYQPAKELLIDHFVYFNPEKSILGPTYLCIKLEDINSSTQLKLIQGNYQDSGDWDWFYDVVKESWPKVLQNLKTYLESNGK